MPARMRASGKKLKQKSQKKFLYPKYLAGGHGPAQWGLQMFLLGAGFNKPYSQDGVHQIERYLKADGDYGQTTCAAVRWLQRQLGFKGRDVDGKFGPGTRRRVRQEFGFDFNKIPVSALLPRPRRKSKRKSR